MSPRQMASAAAKFAPMFWERVSADFRRPVSRAPHHPDFSQWPETGLHAAWIGHSTIVLKIDGFAIITDPVFSTRAGLNIGPLTLGIKRLVEPAGTLKELPQPGLILLSHAHMDHFDIPSLRRLENRTATVVTAAKTSDLLRVNRYGDVRELHWGEQTRVGPAAITAFQVKHWGARMQNDTQRGYNGYVVQVGRYRVLFGGDTALTNTFRALRGLGKIDLAIMPIGAYDPWISVHCNPEQALAMSDEAGAEFILPVHNQTFLLSREPLLEPIERLTLAVGAHSDRICLQQIGQEFHLD